MPVHHLTVADAAAALAPAGVGAPGDVLVVDLDTAAPGGPRPSPPGVAPVVVIGTSARPGGPDQDLRAACDVVLGAGDDLHAILSTVARSPLASTALVLLLRGAEERSLEEGLRAESATYSALQGGPELAAWLATRPVRERPPEGDPIRLERAGARLEITLRRPHVRNALDVAMRDALLDAFLLPQVDPSITEVVLRGDGPAFCAGGDLDEFGTLPDPATAHLVRLRCSVGRAVAAVADRTTALVHGACMGSGIELAAFAGRVVARPDAQIGLPELGLGLVPGAGGTVSLPRRIGRWRTAQLALVGAPIPAATALAWGLVDEVADP